LPCTRGVDLLLWLLLGWCDVWWRDWTTWAYHLLGDFEIHQEKGVLLSRDQFTWWTRRSLRHRYSACLRCRQVSRVDIVDIEANWFTDKGWNASASRLIESVCRSIRTAWFYNKVTAVFLLFFPMSVLREERWGQTNISDIVHFQVIAFSEMTKFLPVDSDKADDRPNVEGHPSPSWKWPYPWRLKTIQCCPSE
jgi:hypothetical protein